MQRVLLNGKYEEDLAATAFKQEKKFSDLRVAHEEKLADEFSSSTTANSTLYIQLAFFSSACDEKNIEIGRLQAELSAVCVALDEKVAEEVARARVVLEDTRVQGLLDVAAHFDSKLAMELANISCVHERKLAAEL